MSLRTRLVLGVLVLAVIGLVTADVATYLSLRSFLLDRTDRSLETAHRVVEATLLRRGPTTPADGRTLSAAAPGVYIQIRKPDGQVIFRGLTPSISGRRLTPASGRADEDHAARLLSGAGRRGAGEARS